MTVNTNTMNMNTVPVEQDTAISPRTITKKSIALVVVVLVSLLAMGGLLSLIQTNLSMNGYAERLTNQSKTLPSLLKKANKTASEDTQSFDKRYQSRAEAVAFMANHNAGFEVTDTKMAEYKQLLNVDNVLVVSKDGNVLAKAADTKANFTYARFNQLRSVFSTGEPSAALEIELPDQNWTERYYAAKIDDNTMAVIEESPEELRATIEKDGSVAAALKNVTVGSHGYAFAIDAKDYLITYHPNSKLIGADAIVKGVDVANLSNGVNSWITLDGQRLYARTTLINDVYYVVAVPESDITGARNITVAVTLFAFFMITTAVAMYGIFVMRDDSRKAHNPEHFTRFGRLRYNRTIGQRATVLSIVGLVLVLVVAFYMQTLFALSVQSVNNSQHANSIAKDVAATRTQVKQENKKSAKENLITARIAAYALKENSGLENKKDLQDLANVLDVANVYVFDVNGNMTASNAPYEHFSLSNDPKD